MKLRASYGETGNDNILDSDGDPDYYPYQTLYGLGYKNEIGRASCRERV